MEGDVPITIRDVADLLLAARGRIDFYWNFYAVVVIAVIGWLVSLKKTLTRPIKLLVSVAFIIAAAMNLIGLYSAYTLAEALRADFLRMGATAALADTRLVLEQHSFLTQRVTAVGIHRAIGIAILFVVWFVQFSEPEEHTPPKSRPPKRR